MSLLPPGWTTATVYGQYLRLDGMANVGSIEFTSEQVLRVDDGTGEMVLVVPKQQRADLDAEGRFSIDLPTADWTNLEYNGWSYHVSEQISGGREIDIVLLASDSPLNLVEAIPVVPPPELVGTQGPPNVLTIGTVTTLPAGEAATAQIDGTSPHQQLSLGIPQGPPGPPTEELRQLVVGPRPMSDFGWYGAYANSTYVTIDKPDEQEDASHVFTVNGAARWEVGATTEVPGHANDYHVKRVTGVAGAEVFTDVLMVDWTTGNTWLPSPFMLGIGGKPVYPLHVSSNAPAGRTAVAVQNANMGAGSQSAELIFATGPGGTWTIGNDYGMNAGNNLFIASSTGGLQFLMDDTGATFEHNVTVDGTFGVAGLATLGAGLLLGTAGAFQQGAIYYSAALGVVHGAKTAATYDWSLTDPNGLSVLTLATGTKKLTAWDTLTANNGVVITGAGAFQQGAVYKDPALGLVLAPIAGTANDLTLTDRAGNSVLTLAQGTKQLTAADNFTVLGDIKGNGYFSTDGAGVVLSCGAGGMVYLRPNGRDSAVGQATVSSAGALTVGGAMTVNCALGGVDTFTVNNPGSSPAGSSISFGSPGSNPGLVAQFSTTKRRDIQFTNAGIQLAVSPNTASIAVQYTFGETGNFTLSGVLLPAVDNSKTFGTSSARWTVVYATTGTINTSDAREKTAITALTADELAAAKDVAQALGTYQWLTAVQLKGADARLHVGITVQTVIAIMQAHNLDPMHYGFVCYDQWVEQPEVTDPETGEVVQPYVPAGDRYGLRYDELSVFIARGLEARIAAIEAQVGL
jgi:hypothetical protein